MRPIRLILERTRLLEDERWAVDEGLGDAARAKKALAANAQALGAGSLPGWLLLPIDGALRGLRTYQTLNYKLPTSVQWLTWPLIGLLSAAAFIGYVLGAGPDWLVGACVGPALAVAVAVSGAIFEIGRAVFGSSNLGRLAAAGLTGLIVPGTLLATVAWSDGGGSLPARSLLVAAARGVLVGIVYEGIILAALGRLWRRSPRGAT
ncbi:MAG: hypothetical protein JNJ80_16935 [Gemmatimonadetes bacterium]|nr:hypothetical protein [Gemmatimonadota bacterium]